jgi:hypothetical protein
MDLVARIGRSKTGIGMDMDLKRYKIATNSPGEILVVHGGRE